MSSRARVWTFIVGISVILGIIVSSIYIYQFIASHQLTFLNSSTSINPNTTGGGDPTNGPGQEFTQQNTVQGPAIVEWWTGDVNGNNQAINCGTFKLPSGQSFTWTHLGHFWTSASDAAVNAEWDGHVRAYQAKSVNALCGVGNSPS